MAYTKINFQNLPSTSTPVNATNLNAMQTNTENEFKNYFNLTLGTPIGDNSDLNDFTTPGIYYSLNASKSATLSNTPITTAGFKLIVEYVSATNRLSQIIIVNSTHSIMYVRNNTGSWNAWQQLASFTTVTDTNGTAIKYADGTLIQYGVIPKTNFLMTTTASSTVQGITWYRSNVADTTFPVSFTNTDYSISLQVFTSTSGSRMYTTRAMKNTSSRFTAQLISIEDFLETAAGYTNLTNVSWQAIGRWY